MNKFEKGFEYLQKFFRLNLHNNKYFLKLSKEDQDKLEKVLYTYFFKSGNKTSRVVLDIATLPFLSHENLMESFITVSVDYPEDQDMIRLRDVIRGLDFPTTFRDQYLNISESLRKVVVEQHFEVYYNWIANYNKSNKSSKTETYNYLP